ncbi:Nif3-like dinuclear metal center hexameric protein [Clostridium sp.]|uniref:Nif3-like dinuclear metal center hexameric protein n=1 Tax=Clostridium sp. TaxID=1506 RepID=UPI001B78642A|nr:Nif3-like dinuclear metal center hexameric protein [Clostridium sp.]MBP3915971.1 Nif3-like dinuclear metal center hexameric protein [Clostridium sp.]
MKKVNDIIREMEKIAPTFLKEDFDNVGLMVGDREKSVKKILLALDCTLKVIEEAKRENVDLIITHHPLIFRKPSNITTDTLQGKKIIELIKNDISLYSSHTNLDSVENGLNHTIVSMLGFENSKILEKNKREESAGLGRIVKFQEVITLEELVEKVKKSLKINNLRVVKGNDNISKIAIINGSGQDFIGKAVNLGVDTIITGDTTYHFASDYKEMGINIIDVGHFGSEQIVFFNVMEKLKEKFEDIDFITSNVEVDPYSFY